MPASAALWSAAVLFILSLEGPPLSRRKPRPSLPPRVPRRVVVAGLQTRQREAASALSSSFVSACDLSSALGRLFSAVAVVVAGLQTRQRDGREPPVSSRGQRGICFSPLYLGQTLVQTLPIAQHEYINAYDTDTWRETIRESHE